MRDKAFTPISLLCAVLILLWSVSFIDFTQINFLHLNNVDIFSDIRIKKKQKLKQLPKVIVDTVNQNGKFILPGDVTLIADYGIDSNYSLLNFFNKLDLLKKTNCKMRIAYFGDSFIEGDYVTDELRIKLQETYGGDGIGFLPVQSNVEGDYNYLNFKSNNSWSDKNFVNSNNFNLLGLSGHVFYATGTAATTFSLKKGSNINVVKFYSGKTNIKSPILSVVKDNNRQNVLLTNTTLVNETLINSSPIHTLKVAISESSIPVYGISMEDTAGIYVDNYGFRGNTGILTNKITTEVMKEFQNYLKYDLIIVHYGLNAIVHGQKKFSWFANGQDKLIQKIKGAFPNVPILFISTSDLGYKQNGEWITEPGVPYMVETQRSIAQNNKVAFWDLYSSMGGENTIVSWAERQPKLAAMDYMHLSSLGAKKVADIFYNKIMESKKYYQKSSQK